MKTLFFILICCLLCDSCTRREGEEFVPESLPYSSILADSRTTADSLMNFSVGYDSIRRCDELIYLVNAMGWRAQMDGMQATAYIGPGFHFFDQVNFAFGRYPGIERVMLVPFALDFLGSGELCDIYHIYCKDSIIVGIHRWKPRDRFQNMVTIPRKDAHYLIPLALWYQPALKHWLYVFRKSNRIVARDSAQTDTLFYYDIQEARIRVRTPVGAKLEPIGIVHSDSLLWLSGSHSMNGLGYGGFDDRHAYIMALDTQARICYADTFGLDTEIDWMPSVAQEQIFIERKFGFLPNLRSSNLIAIDKNTCRRTNEKKLPFYLGAFFWEVSSAHEGKRYLVRRNTNALLVCDSAFTILEEKEIPYTPGPIVGSLVENEHDILKNSMVWSADINRDNVNDKIGVNVEQQIVVTDGVTLEPLLVTKALPALRKYTFLRREQGSVDILVLYGERRLVCDLYTITPTPFLTRVWAHGDRITFGLLIVFVFPLAVVLYLQRRKVVAAQRQRDILLTAVHVVHDAKTPLQTALLTLQLLYADIRKNTAVWKRREYDEQNTTIESSIVEATDSINRCIYLAKKSSAMAVPEEVCLYDVVADWLKKVGSRYHSRGFYIQNNIPPDIPALPIIRQAFYFLLQCACDNAVQWTAPESKDKTVTIEAIQEKKTVTLCINDKGIGMSKEVLERALHKPGFSTREMGSGLGMLIIHKSCKEHGARLRIGSTLGKGTTLYIEFPYIKDVG